MADNALTKMSLNGQLGVSFASALLVGGLFYYFYYADAVTERETKTARLEALQTEIRGLEVTANRLQEFQREVQLLEAKLETLKRILPPAKETPDLMRKVQALAAQSNLQIKIFTPLAVVNKDFYQEWPINVSVQGTYHNLALFFDRIGRLSRLVNVGDLKIASLPTQSVSGTITASCVATTFVYVDTPPPAAGAPAGAPRPQ
jgi:type IV pilus assembly protein PilO